MKHRASRATSISVRGFSLIGAIILSLFVDGSTQAQTIAYWNFGGTAVGDTATQSNQVTTLDSHLTATTFFPSHGRSLTYVSGSGSASGNRAITQTAWNTGGTGALDTSLAKYYDFTLTVQSGFTMDITNFSFYDQASSANNGFKFQVQFSLDGFATAGINISSATAVHTAMTLNTFALSGTQYQNLTSTVEFRIWAWSASVAGTTWRVDDITLQGTFAAIGGASDISWNTTSGTGDFNTGGNWVGGVTPGADKTASLTNAITANVTVTNGNVAGTQTVGNLVISNTTAFTHTLLVSNNVVMRVDTNTLVGAQGVLSVVSAAGGADSIFSNGSLQVNSGGVVTLTNAGANAAKVIAGAITNNAGGTVRLGFTSGGTASNVISATGNFLNSGSLELNGLAGATVRSNFVNASLFTNAAGGRVVVNSGENFIRGDKLVNAGTNLLSGGTLHYESATGGNAALDNAGTVLLAGGSLVVNTLTNTSAGLIRGNGTVSGTIINQASGVIDATNGILTLLNTPAMLGTVSTRNDGSLKFGANGDLNITNAGVINFFGGTIIAGEITNTATGLINTRGTDQAVISNRVVNLGIMNVTNAILRVTGGVTNAATGNINLRSGGTLSGGVITNAGFITAVAGGNIDPTVVNSGTMVLNGTMVVSNINNLAVAGAGGVLSNASSANLVINGGSFINKSVNSNAFNLVNTSVTLQNGAGVLTFDVAGSDFGPVNTGFNNNYALSALTITNYSVLLQTAGFSITGSNAIYLANLDLMLGATLDLGGLNIYYTGTTNINGTLVLNGGQIIQIAAPPPGNIVYTSSGGSQDYDVSGSWDANQRATNSVNNVLVAIGGGTVVTQNTTAAAFTIASMTVSNASTLVLGRNQTWAGGGTIDTTGTLRITNNVTLTSSVLITNSGTVRGAGTITGLVTARAGSSLDSSNGTLRLLTQPVLEGTVNVRNNSTLDVGSNHIINNGVINMFGGTILDGELTNNGILNVQANNNLINNALVNAAGAFLNATGGTLVVTPDLVNFGTVTNSATLIVSNLTALTLGTITNGGAGLIRMSGGTLTSGAITNAATIQGNGTISGTIINLAGGLVEVTNGTLKLLSAPQNSGNILVGGTLQISNNAGVFIDWSNAGTLEVRRGTVASGNITNTGTIIGSPQGGTGNANISANVINNFKLFATNGFINLTGGLTNSSTGTIDISSDGTLTITPSWTNAGTVVLRNRLVSSNDVNNSGTIVVAAGTGNTATLTTPAGSLINSGTVDVQSGIFALVSPTSSTVTNLAGGTYRLANESTRIGTGALASSSNNFYNAGTFIHFNNGTVVMGQFINVGTVVLSNTVADVFTINGSTAGIKNTFSNASLGRVLIGGSTTGTNSFFGAIVNLGTIDALPGGGILSSATFGFTNAAGGVIQNTNSVGTTLGIRATGDSIVNQGTILVSGGNTITFMNTANPATGAEWSNQNTLVIGSVGNAAFFNSGTINNVGTITAVGTINMTVGTATPRPLNQGAGGRLIVPDAGSLTITHLAVNRLSIGAGTLQVGAGSTLRIFTDVAAATNAILLNSAKTMLYGGTIISANVTNNAGATIAGYGTLSFNNGPLPGSVSNLINLGTIIASNASSPLVLDGARVFNQTNGTIQGISGRLIVMGVFTNSGMVNFLNSVGTFNNTVINNGAWISDPTTNVFNSDLFVNTNGYIAASSGDVYRFQSNFVNVSSRSNDFNTLGAKFVFDGTNVASGISYTQAFYVAGINMQGTGTTFMAPVETSPTNFFRFAQDDPIFGFSNNFALGTLEIGNIGTNSILSLVDAFLLTNIYGTNFSDGKVAGLYVDQLTLWGSSILIVSNNVQLYYKNATNIFLDGPGQNVFLLGNASFHQLFVVPEPNILLLLMFGALVVHVRRSIRRRRVL